MRVVCVGCLLVLFCSLSAEEPPVEQSFFEEEYDEIEESDLDILFEDTEDAEEHN